MTILRQWGSSTIRQELVLGRSAPFLEIRNEVEWNEDQRELSVAFEPAVAPDLATFEIPYGTIARSGWTRCRDSVGRTSRLMGTDSRFSLTAGTAGSTGKECSG